MPARTAGIRQRSLHTPVTWRWQVPVRSDDGRPVEGALAELHPVSDSTLTVYTLASELGFYSFRDLELGTYVLTVTRIGFREHRSIARSWSEVS